MTGAHSIIKHCPVRTRSYVCSATSLHLDKPLTSTVDICDIPSLFSKTPIFLIICKKGDNKRRTSSQLLKLPNLTMRIMHVFQSTSVVADGGEKI